MSQRKPNVVYVVCHDLGRTLGCYAEPSVRSPALDNLASEGVRFAQSFCTAPSCSPSRGSLITGRHPHSNGLMGLVNNGWDLPASEKTINQYLKKAGYQTALFGLQHERLDPTTFGYDVNEGCDFLRRRNSGLSCRQVIPRVIEYLRGRHEGPFFVNIGVTEVHRKYHNPRYEPADPDQVHVPAYLPDHPIVRKELAGLYGLVTALDTAMADLMDAIDRAGLRDNTLLIFTTDHGIDMPLAKGTLYDPGIETALLARWPDGFEGGKVMSHLVSHVDVLPTVLEAAGAEPAPCIQGRSFLPLLQGEPYEPRRHVFAEKTHHCLYDPMRCIRTERYKFIHNFGRLRAIEVPADAEMDVLACMGEVYARRRPCTELYDLADDPVERANLSGHPEYAAIESELKDTLLSWLTETDDPLLKGHMPLPDVL